MPQNPPFATIGDEPIEARIVAWVLGDASAFEAAELERLCDERPELLVFRRRMRALHGLLIEAEAAAPHHSSKLPPAKRQALDAIFGAEKPPSVIEHPGAARSRRYSWRQSLLAIAACLVLLAGLAAVFSSGSLSILSARKGAGLAMAERQVASEQNSEVAIQELKKAIRKQEDAVEERRKVLANVTRAKGIIYNEASKNEQRGEAIKRGLDAQDFVDAKHDFEAEQDLLQKMKLKLMGEEISSKMPSASIASAPATKAVDTSLAFFDTPKPGVPQGSSDLAANAKRPPEEEERSKLAQAGPVDLDGPVGQMQPEALVGGGQVAGLADSSKAGVRARQLMPTSKAKRALAESAASSYSIPEAADRLAEMPALPGADGLAAGSGGLGAAHGVGGGHAPQAPAAAEPRAAGAMAKNAETSQRAPDGLRSDTTTLTREDRDGAVFKSELAPADSLARRDKNTIASNLGILTEESLEKKKDSTVASTGMRSGEGDVNRGSIDQVLRDFDAKSPAAETAKPAPAAVLVPTTPSPREPADKDANGGAVLDLDLKTAYFRETTDPAGKLEWKDNGRANEPAQGQKSDSLPGLVQGEKQRRQSALGDSDRFVVEARDAYAKSNYQEAYDNYVKAFNLLVDVPSARDRSAFLRKAIAEVAVAQANAALKAGGNGKAKDWLGKAVQWDPNNEAARQKVVADVASESTAADAPYSTFSLSISDASFKMAQAAMARGEQPDPASIKTEQFYNALDYGDPAPGPNEAVAGWVEQAAHPVIPGRNLVRVAIRTGTAGRSAAQPLRLTLLVDQSGSMARDDRRAAMALALKQLGGLLTQADLVTVIGFARSPRLLADALTGDQAAKLNELVNQAASEGGTNLEEAMKLGEQMALRHLTPGAQNRIVLFTDGAANLGDADPSRLADKVTAMRQQGLAFDIAGIGTSNLNDQLLAELARHGNGRYCVVGAETDAGGGFARQLAGAFRPAAENVKVQVRFNPQRVGRYKLLGFDEHRLKTEDFRNDAVDAAELAAEEAGVALYQVEPLAEGSGEIGEASLRFRDAASGRMVERTWTIPYEASAPAFDRATPSLQLAGLAMLAAEKLRGGPLAEAIDFKQLAAPRATVKQFYSNSRRVAEMLEMVNGL